MHWCKLILTIPRIYIALKVTCFSLHSLFSSTLSFFSPSLLPSFLSYSFSHFFCLGPPSLINMISELHTVVDWFHLGLNLEVPKHELLKIEADFSGSYSGKTERCKIEMLNWWLKNTEQKTWLDIVRALVRIQMTGLAQKIAERYGQLVEYNVLLGMFCRYGRLFNSLITSSFLRSSSKQCIRAYASSVSHLI